MNLNHLSKRQVESLQLDLWQCLVGHPRQRQKQKLSLENFLMSFMLIYVDVNHAFMIIYDHFNDHFNVDDG